MALARRFALMGAGLGVVTFLVLQNTTGVLAAFAVWTWAAAFNVCSTTYRRFLALHGRLKSVPISTTTARTDELLYGPVYRGQRRLDFTLLLSLYTVGLGSTILWRYSSFALPLIYSLAIGLDAMTVRESPIRLVRSRTESIWSALVVAQPLGYLPLWMHLGGSPESLLLSTIMFWVLQAVGFAAIIKLQTRDGRDSPNAA